jgi:wyosine [tRNA(Phe)-imidazoG37] synthetase (radical SAM superfamily)
MMGTFLFNEIIFGPVKSRRLGVSLGINLMPTDMKVCSFDCIYCECGWTPKSYPEKAVLPTRTEVKQKLEETLDRMAREKQLPDVITFAGNGEPTLHPGFPEIIADTIKLRNKIAPKAKVAVLSNATQIFNNKVFNALLLADDNIQKLDSGFENTIRIMDCPVGNFNLAKTVSQLEKFNGKVIIQTMFLKGSFKGQSFDNTTEEEVVAWLKLISRINPSQVMIYTIDRDTPASGLEKIKISQLQEIAARTKGLGISAQVSG